MSGVSLGSGNKPELDHEQTPSETKKRADRELARKADKSQVDGIATELNNLKKTVAQLQQDMAELQG